MRRKNGKFLRRVKMKTGFIASTRSSRSRSRSRGKTAGIKAQQQSPAIRKPSPSQDHYADQRYIVSDCRLSSVASYQSDESMVSLAEAAAGIMRKGRQRGCFGGATRQKVGRLLANTSRQKPKVKVKKKRKAASAKATRSQPLSAQQQLSPVRETRPAPKDEETRPAPKDEPVSRPKTREASAPPESSPSPEYEMVLATPAVEQRRVSLSPEIDTSPMPDAEAMAKLAETSRESSLDAPEPRSPRTHVAELEAEVRRLQQRNDRLMGTNAELRRDNRELKKLNHTLLQTVSSLNASKSG